MFPFWLSKKRVHQEIYRETIIEPENRHCSGFLTLEDGKEKALKELKPFDHEHASSFISTQRDAQGGRRIGYRYARHGRKTMMSDHYRYHNDR